MVGADNVRAMLGRLIREESVRTYLFTYAHVYASLSLRSLADMFELPRQRVHSLVSKMIINEELLASLDDPSECAILHRSEPTRMQALALQLADKVIYLSVPILEYYFVIKLKIYNMLIEKRGYLKKRSFSILASLANFYCKTLPCKLLKQRILFISCIFL